MTRGAAKIVWGALLVMPLAFLPLAWARRGSAPAAPADLLFWIAVIGSAAGIALSRVVPPRIRPSAAGREATAFVRLLFSWSLCGGAALLALVALQLTGDERLVGAAAIDLLALLVTYPSDGRWAEVTPEDGDDAMAAGGAP